MIFDHIIVGAGFAGCVMAERLATQLGSRVLIIEQRNHIGGNCFDFTDEHGLMVHKYGPHLFHTDSSRVFQYLSLFTEWLDYQHEVLASVDGKNVPIPFNLNSLYSLFPSSMASSLEKKLVNQYGFNTKVPILELRKTKDQELRALADFIYEKVFVNYTAKQWGCKPEEISPEVTARVPVYVSKDNRYFQDTYQAVPKNGYTKLFENMIDSNNVSLLLNCHYKDILEIDVQRYEIKLLGLPFKGRIIYTGRVDELFDYCNGELPYRSLKFKFENYHQPFFQDCATVNYPNNYDFTRITEFKRITRQEHDTTSIAREFPEVYDQKHPERCIPYYPVFTECNQKKYMAYSESLKPFSQILPLGRLAEYKYYDMDDIVEKALNVFHEEFVVNK